MISITDTALNKVKTLIKKREKGLGIIIGIKPTGCSGLAYVLKYVDSLESVEDAVCIKHEEVNLYIEKRSVEFLKGLTIDYVKKGLNEGFEFINPNETGRCGCGESFKI